jgi:hypothetical protein
MSVGQDLRSRWVGSEVAGTVAKTERDILGTTLLDGVAWNFSPICGHRPECGVLVPSMVWFLTLALF